MIGRPGGPHDGNGSKSTASYLAHVLLASLCFRYIKKSVWKRMGFVQSRGVTSVVLWNLRPVKL